MKILFVYPDWPKLDGQTSFRLPPLGMIQAAGSVPSDFEISVCDENVQSLDFSSDCDLVGISIMLTCQAPRAYEIAAEFKKRGKPVVMGGLHVALCPDEAAQHADSIVVGEGEGLIPKMLGDFQAGKLATRYQHKDFFDLEAVPLPRRDLYNKKEHYSYKGWELVDLVETSRGCRFNCYPCCTPYLGGRQHRIKPMEKVLADIGNCSDLLFIVDNSLEQNIDYEKALFRELANVPQHWISHPITCKPEVLKLAKESGCWYVYHAIYDISDKIKDRIKMYHDFGIGVEGTILLGLDNHTEDFIKRFIDFLLEIDLDLAEFTVLTPFPHTQAYQELHKQGRIIDRDWRHYNAGNVVYQPKHMNPDKLQQLFEQAWQSFYAKESQSLRMSKLFLNLRRNSDLGPKKRQRHSKPGRI
jgi:radical SAM superfamily enzyme YgiQ (UPF0313 family)